MIWNRKGNLIGIGDVGVAYRYEDKVIKIYPRAPTNNLVAYAKRKSGDSWDDLLWNWTAAECNNFTIKLLDEINEPWAPKIYEHGKLDLDFNQWQQIQKDVVSYCEQEVVTVWNYLGTNPAKFPVYYVIMEYLPRPYNYQNDEMSEKSKHRWHRKLAKYLWENYNVIIRDASINSGNYRLRKNGTIVMFDPMMTLVPSMQSYESQSTLEALIMKYQWLYPWTNRQEVLGFFNSALRPHKTVNNHLVSLGSAQPDNPYYRGTPEDVFMSEELDYTPYEIMNSNVIGSVWSENV